MYQKLGEIQGIIEIMTSVFSAIKDDAALFKFYQDKNLDVLQKRYAYYIAGCIGGRFDWMG